MALIKLAALCSAALLGSSGCGTQFSDPILDQEPPATCPARYVAHFDGASYGSATRLIQDDFTIEAWIKTSQSPSGTGFFSGAAIVFADVETIQTDDFASGILNHQFIMTVGGPDTAATSTSPVDTGEWVHVAASRSKADGLVLLYVNGVLEDSAVGNDHTLGQAPTISIGGRTGRNFFDGLMSEVRLWRRVRSQAELRAHMHRPLSGSETDLIGYYRFDESAGALAHDASVSGNDAMLNGGVTWVQAVVPLCEL